MLLVFKVHILTFELNPQFQGRLLMCQYGHLYLQVEWPLPAHLDLYQIVIPSSRSRKCRCFFHERDLTFLRVDPAIITLTSGSSWIPVQSRVEKNQRSWSNHTFDTTPSTSVRPYIFKQTANSLRFLYLKSGGIIFTHVNLQDPLLLLNHANGKLLLKRNRC